MTVEVRPLGDKCNIQCSYCYQEGIRTAGNLPSRYDVDAILATLDRIGERFSLFGGEIMMVRDADLERLLAHGLERHGGTGMQTNGTLVEERHLALFRDHAVRVGVSIDGPGPLNDARDAGNEAATRRATARTEALVETLARAGMPPTVIVTLHRLNAGPGRIELLADWLRFLDGLGIPRARLHVLEADTEAARDALGFTVEEGLAVMRRLRALEPEFRQLRFDVFAEMAAMLRGDDVEASCVFHACDSLATQAVTGVEGDGRLTNCGRTNKDGIGYLKAEGRGYERQQALYRTDWADGGCRGCRFFLMCKGNCPGTAIDGDWRLRTADCRLWYGLFEDLEAEMAAAGETPLSLSPHRPAIERAMLEAWAEGLNPALAALRDRIAAEAEAEAEAAAPDGAERPALADAGTGR